MSEAKVDLINEQTVGNGVDIDQGKIKDGTIHLVEQASTPANPASGSQIIYPKTDGKLYKLQDDGTEEEVGSGGGGGGFTPIVGMPIQLGALLDSSTPTFTYSPLRDQYGNLWDGTAHGFGITITAARVTWNSTSSPVSLYKGTTSEIFGSFNWYYISSFGSYTVLHATYSGFTSNASLIDGDALNFYFNGTPGLDKFGLVVDAVINAVT